MFFHARGRDARIIAKLPHQVDIEGDKNYVIINHICLPDFNSLNRIPKSCRRIQAIRTLNPPDLEPRSIFQNSEIEKSIPLGVTAIKFRKILKIAPSDSNVQIRKTLIKIFQAYDYIEPIQGSSYVYFKGNPKFHIFWGKTGFARCAGINRKKLNKLGPNDRLISNFMPEDNELNVYLHEKKNKEPIIAIFEKEFNYSALIHHTVDACKNWQEMKDKLINFFTTLKDTTIRSIKFTNPLINDVIMKHLDSKSAFNNPLAIATIEHDIDLRPNFYMLYCDIIDYNGLDADYERIMGLIHPEKQEFHFHGPFKEAKIYTKSFNKVIFEIRDPDNNLVEFDAKDNKQIAIAFSIGENEDVCGAG